MSSELMTTTLPIGSGKKDLEVDVIPLEDFSVELKISNSKSEITLDVVTLEDVDNVDAVLSTERYTLEINQPLKATTNLSRKLSYLVIVLAMISIASGGVAFKMFPDEVTPILACFWRAQAMVVCLLPLVVVEIMRMNKDDRNKLRDGKVWANIIYCGIASSIWSGTFAVALDFSSVTQVYLLNNCQPILLVLWFKLKGRPISIFQATGVAIGMVGLALTIFGESGTAMELSLSDALGDGIAFLGAIFAASYISVGSSTRSQFPGTFTFVFSMWVVSLVVFLAGTLLFERPELSSLFNWYVDGIWPIVLWLALVTGLIGISGVILVMKYLTPLTVSVTLLCEPVVATSLAVIMRIEELPSAVTWVGAVVVMLGVILVSIESRRLKARYPKLFPTLSEEMTAH